MIANPLREAPRQADGKPLPGKPTRRLNANLPEKIFEHAEQIAWEHNWTITDVVRLGIGLLKVGYDAAKQGNRLAVVDEKGRVVEKILLPA
jgi:hypothetical protein